ncbi:hypothetical protein K438DRAFT_1497433, partial [Mycena galopus ATCC 62051]
YKPVDRKVKPVPTTQPDPHAHFFRPIPRTSFTVLPTHPPDYRSLPFGSRVTLKRLESMLSKIEPGILSTDETNLLAYITVIHYKFPTIEHIPWQKKPIPIPHALMEDVRKVIIDNEKSGRFEPTVSSYRCAMFPVMKKPG